MTMEDTKVYEEMYHGYRIVVYPDPEPIAPDKDSQDELFLTAFHRDFFVHPKEFPADRVRAVLQDAKHPDRKEYYVFPIEAYIHSGVVVALAGEGSFPDRQWDVSNPVGAIFVARGGWKTEKSAREAAQSLIDGYNDYLSGNVYGWAVYDRRGRQLESVWGYYGNYEQPGGALDEARGHADYLRDSTVKAHNQKRKAQIKKGVPLEYREPMTT